MDKPRFFVCKVTPDGRLFVRTCAKSPTRNVVKEWTTTPKEARRFAYDSARSVAQRNGGFLVSERMFQ